MIKRICFCLLFVFIAAGFSEARIMTRWAGQLQKDNILSEYPRPQMVRENWKNLNGQWDYAIRPNGDGQPDEFDGDILVPFCAESALSGVKKKVGGANQLWYRREFKLPAKWEGKRVILHFGAVDWKMTLWLNGKRIGSHKGGYNPFSFDITEALSQEGSQEIIVSVWDPADEGTQPRGKQVSNPGGIWYTSVTGIWQTVWLEPVNEAHIKSIKIVPDIDKKFVKVTTICSKPAEDYTIEIKVTEDGSAKAKGKGKADSEISISIENPKLWRPDSPFLYDLEIELISNGKIVDQLSSYFGMRKICLGKDEKGITRMMLNNKFLFQFGFLDQGWWPDGLYTAPTDEALRYDIEVTKKLGFNLARKHVKREPARWYYWCDKLGLLVWQDMPSGDKYISGDEPDIEKDPESARQFKLELKRMIEDLKNHPSIVSWVPYNEGWGQWKTGKITKMIKKLDPTRLVNSASGWTDRGTGDIKDIHDYPGPSMPEPEEERAIVLGEFGGLGLPVEGHTWQDKENWGYRSYQNPAELTEAYSHLIKELYPMIDKGLSAAVYTQTTDVEVETNGMMTYDRAVIKMDLEDVQRINKGYIPPIIESEDSVFLDTGKVRISNPTEKGRIRYTLDGSEPDKNSDLYNGPITLTDTTTVKARTYWSDGTKSGVSEYTCRKVTLREPKQVSGLQPGLKFAYYQNDAGIWGKLPEFSELEPKAGGIAGVCDLTFAERDNNFAFKFEGYIKVPADGIYTFYTNSDDGSKLFIDGAEVVNNDLSHPMRERSGMIALCAGTYPFAVTFYQGVGGKGLEVGFKGPRYEKQTIPTEVLFHKVSQ